MAMAMFKRKFARTIPDNLRAPHIKMWGFEAKRARKFTRTLPRTLPWTYFITMLFFFLASIDEIQISGLSYKFRPCVAASAVCQCLQSAENSLTSGSTKLETETNILFSSLSNSCSAHFRLLFKILSPGTKRPRKPLCSRFLSKFPSEGPLRS